MTVMPLGPGHSATLRVDGSASSSTGTVARSGGNGFGRLCSTTKLASAGNGARHNRRYLGLPNDLRQFLILGCGNRWRLYGTREQRIHHTAHRQSRQLVVVGDLVQLRAERPLLKRKQPKSLIAVQALHPVSHPKLAASPGEMQEPEVLSDSRSTP